MSVFTPEEREQLREALVAAARADSRIRAAAHTGSAAVGREDRWSDIDLALCVENETVLTSVVDDWTNRLYHDHGAVAHVDVWSGGTRFRVFLLENTLQVDVAFWLPDQFGAYSPKFRLAFGTANERPFVSPPAASDLVGMAWLYALHVRSSIARGRLWQAEWMLSHMRDEVLSLACLRHGLPAREGRGLDDLPSEVTRPLERTLVSRLGARALGDAFAATVAALLTEARFVDPALAARLTGPLDSMVK
jgi:predicted nucleotidyltransferase